MEQKLSMNCAQKLGLEVGTRHWIQAGPFQSVGLAIGGQELLDLGAPGWLLRMSDDLEAADSLSMKHPQRLTFFSSQSLDRLFLLLFLPPFLSGLLCSFVMFSAQLALLNVIKKRPL